MIKAHVRTNQDDVNCYVNEFVALPRIGEQIYVKYDGERVLSRVCSIYHGFNKCNEPWIEIEVWSETIHQQQQRSGIY